MYLGLQILGIENHHLLLIQSDKFTVQVTMIPLQSLQAYH